MYRLRRLNASFISENGQLRAKYHVAEKTSVVPEGAAVFRDNRWLEWLYEAATTGACATYNQHVLFLLKWLLAFIFRHEVHLITLINW